jgi:hypothetical protein
MNSRRLTIALAIGACGLALSGCETLGRRHSSTSQPPAHWGKEPDQGSTDLPEEARNQHKGGGMPGALSSQGSDIEKSLGVGR